MKFILFDINRDFCLYILYTTLIGQVWFPINIISTSRFLSSDVLNFAEIEIL